MNPEETEAKPEGAQRPTSPEAAPAAGAVVEKRKKKRKYSKGLKELQQVERTVSRASSRVARAVAKGMATYRKRSDKSSLEKRDGTLRDFAVNLAEGVGKTLRVISSLPSDLAKGLDTKRSRKRVRRQLKVASRILRPRA